MPYHINPATGRANKCTARLRCRFGSADDHHATAQEARHAYEASMADAAIPTRLRSKSIRQSAILLPPSPARPPNEDAKQAQYHIEYDYDDYSCDGSTCGGGGYDYETDTEVYSESICRDRVYTGLRVTEWSDSDGVHGYARSALALPPGPLPDELQKALAPYEDIEDLKDDFDIRGEGDYYGEVVAADTPPALPNAVNDYFYPQPAAVDRSGVLPYVRGKGTETQGLRPLDALKKSLEEEGGPLPPRIAKAQAFKVSKIKLDKIDRPDKARQAKAASQPQAPDPVKRIGQDSPVGGVVYQKANGRYELIDGYSRLAHIEQDPDRRSFTYIVLRSDPPARRSAYGYSPRNVDATWSAE